MILKHVRLNLYFPAIPVPLPEQNVFVSYNFEANYNMANIPSDSVPGPLIRLHLNDPYPSVDPTADRDPNDAIARNLNSDGDESSAEITTEIPIDQHEISRRSVNNDAMVFTRKGAYKLIESRLYA
jgi:hypothetical protein